MASAVHSSSRNMESSDDSQAISYEALSAVLQHPDITSNTKTVCSLLQSCKACRAAVQQCAAGQLTVCVSVNWDPFKLARFAGWLPKHGGLVRELHCDGSRIRQQRFAQLETAEKLLAASLKAAAKPATPAAAAAAAMHADTSLAETAAPLLRLRSMQLRFAHSSALLQALPAASLTRLELEHTYGWAPGLNFCSSSIAQALAQLTNLQDLHLGPRTSYGLQHESCWLNSKCLAAVGQLSQLTKLCLYDVAPGSDMALLPGQLRQLQLVLHCTSSSDFAGLNIEVTPSDELDAVDLSHLRQLQQLEIRVTGRWSGAGPLVVLPASLLALAVREHGGFLHRMDFSGLRQLQQLLLHYPAVGPHQVQGLTGLSALTDIKHNMTIFDAQEALSIAQHWRHLPGLRSLTISDVFREDENDLGLAADESQELLQCLGSATGLTNLDLYGAVFHATPAWCAELTKLQLLRRLELLLESPFTCADMRQITMMTQITALHIWMKTPQAGNKPVASGLAALRQLQELDVMDDAANIEEVMPEIAALTGLTELYLAPPTELEPEEVLGRDSLLLLTSLVNLKCLDVSPMFDPYSDDPVEEFWDFECGCWRQQS